ncbi:MAG: tetratricopeptide repeat protein [Opitutaceae bacterium]|jgi:tetratricopeptide (TPR) repeat protein
MKRLLTLLVCVIVLVSTGCSKKPKEVSKVDIAQAASLASEAQFAMQIREYSRAEELIQQALKLRNDMPEYWVSLGMARRKQDDTSGARKAYEKALELHTALYKKDHAPEQLSQQAFVLALLGRTDEAVKLLQKGLKDHPDSPVMQKMADPRGLPRTFQTPEFKALAI